MNADLRTSLQRVIEEHPGTTKNPTTEYLSQALEIHYSTTDGIVGFTKIPPELKGANWSDYSKPTTRAALLAHCEIVTPEALAKLKELAAEHAATIAEQIKFSPRAATDDHMGQRTKLHAIGAERSAPMPAGGFRSLNTIQSEYHEKWAALQTRLELIVKEAFPLCRDVVLLAELQFKEIMVNEEEGGRELAFAMDLKWVPSQLWTAACVNFILARKNIRVFTGRADQGPAQLLEGFVNLK